MKFGICTSINNISALEKMGFDYIETGVAGVASMSEDDFKAAVQLVNRSKIKCEACNGLFPPQIKLVGSGYSEGIMVDYLKKAFHRIVQLGAQTVVLGSGSSRMIPIDIGDGRNQLLNVFRVVGDIASEFGLIIAIEPLNKAETNIINSVKEGLDFVTELSHPNVYLLADFYHMRVENESMKVIMEAGLTIKHLHIANSNGRIYPRSVDEDDYKEFFKALSVIGYNARLSIEGGTENMMADGPVALSVLKTLYNMYT
ncbi:MAG TPA: sugar phosphate isomerase/epimerase [Clostridiales bacterium]|nr:sugar phosphate isomerase/epimerase [Clostridiales bacterium]